MKPAIVIPAFWFVIHHVASAQDFHSLGPGLNGPVYELTVHGTDLYVGGAFTDAGGHPDADYLARWDGSAWHAVAPGLTGPVRAIAVLGAEVYVGGEFSGSFNHAARWDGNAWHALDAGLNGLVYDLACWRDELYAGGSFTAKIAKWTGSGWQPLGQVPNDIVYSLDTTADHIVVGGRFVAAGGMIARGVARWDGQAWSKLDPGLCCGYVRNVHVQGDEVFIAGHFGTNCPEPMLARWDGQAFDYMGFWCEIGHDVAASGNHLYVTMYDFIGGEDRLLRWDLETGAWTYLDIWLNTGTEGGVLAVLGDDLYVGGSFENLHSHEGDHIVRWGNAVTGTTDGDPNAIPGIRVYPSPVDDLLQVEMTDGSETGRLRGVFDVSGKRMIVRSYRDGTFDVAGIPPGVYHLVIETAQGVRKASFMKR